MKIRYEDDLKYEWQLDDSLNDITVPKLILQPLIENCFQHGFHQAGTEILPPWKIQIRSPPRTKTGWLFFPIANNRSSLSKKEKLSNLRRKIAGFTFTGNQDMDHESIFRHQGYVWKIPFSAFISTITVKNISMFPEMKMNRPP
mgnify:CR=1 FL=1